MLLETAKSYICLLLRGPKGRRPASTLVHTSCVTAGGQEVSFASKDVCDGKASTPHAVPLWQSVFCLPCLLGGMSCCPALVDLQDGGATGCRPLAGDLTSSK
jgi:hypothetical protein